MFWDSQNSHWIEGGFLDLSASCRGESGPKPGTLKNDVPVK